MAESSSSTRPQPKILEAIIDAAKNAFDPSVDASSREPGLRKYDELVERTQTWILLHALNTLIKPNVLPPWLRAPLLRTLTLVPLRPDGVRASMEFVFAVHPSSDGQPAEAGAGTGTRGKEGAVITHEAVAVATKLLSSVPSSMSPDTWFRGISGQMFALLDGEAGTDLAKMAAQVVGFGILGKKQFGAPGAPGWNAFVQPLLEDVNPSLRQQRQGTMTSDDPGAGEGDIEVVDVGRDRVVVSKEDLARSLRRLELLIVSNPSPGLCKRVLKPVLPQLWALASWTRSPKDTESQFCRPARGLMQTYLRLFGNAQVIDHLARNLLCGGSLDGEDMVWRYSFAAGGGIEITGPRYPGKAGPGLDWGEIEDKSTTLVTLICAVCPAEEISSVFLDLLRSWIRTASKEDASTILTSSEEAYSHSAVEDLINLRLLQQLMEKAPEKLVSHFDQLLELVCQVLQADGRSPLGDDIIGIVLSLLNLVITAPTFQKSDVNPPELKIVEESLARIGREDGSEVNATARNLAMLLKYRDAVEEPSASSTAPSSRQVEDRKTYNLAMTYVTGNENPPPVVAEGLNLLSGLIVAESPVLDIPAVTVLMASLLRDKEDFINLRVVKIFTQLANKHPRSTMQELVEQYLDAQERLSTDVRLRFGEAILQVIERLGETFTDQVAQSTGETLLSIAGRRGYRPKTMAKQARDARLHELKRSKADDAMSDDDDDDGEEGSDRASNDMLAQILEGWESRRGSEDVRMRTSALSILGSAIETNVGGMGPTLVSAGVDLSVSVLTMEREVEMGILRRAAVLLVLSFVRALHGARERGQRLGFGLTDASRQDIRTTLEYVAATDNDGLVQQHARDVVESLDNWAAMGVLETRVEVGAPGLTRLAGLRLSPGGQVDDGRPRPRIEEVE